MAKRGIIAFVAGFAATLVFHQAVLWCLHNFGYVSRAPWQMQRVPPFGVPAVISLAFWGGVSGVIMMLLIARLRGSAFWVAAILFGAIFPMLVAWFIFAPLKHMPIVWNPKSMMIGLIANGVWGFGTALIYKVFNPR